MVNLTGNASNNWLTGNEGSNVLLGGSGNDSLTGGGGNDTLDGGAGSDDVAFLNGYFSDFVVARPSASDVRLTNRYTGEVTTLRGVEWVSFLDGRQPLSAVTANAASTGNDFIFVTGGMDTLDGLAGNDSLYGWGGSDFLIGGLGNDSLDGGTGDDVMIGGAGNDTYVVDSHDDVVVEDANGGTDLVQVAFLWNEYWMSEGYALGANVENATAITPFQAALWGNSLNNVLTGNEADDILFGGDGNDTLVGNAGSDYLAGGYGADRLVGGKGNDYYNVDSPSDVIVELAGEGEDRMTVAYYAAAGTYVLSANVEHADVNATSPSTGINLTGNALNNHLTGSDGNNVLLGGAGDDVLAGLKGNDTLDGGAGNDLAVFDGSFSDYVISRVSATEIRLTHIDPYSFDTDYSTLVRGVENFLFQGSGSMMLAEVTAGPLGTSGNDTLIGTAGGTSWMDPVEMTPSSD